MLKVNRILYFIIINLNSLMLIHPFTYLTYYHIINHLHENPYSLLLDSLFLQIPYFILNQQDLNPFKTYFL